MAKQADVGRGENTTFGQYSAILEWLEMGNGENFRLITGQATKGMNIVIAGTKTKKRDGFVNMSQFVNEKCKSNWSADNAESRFKSWFKKYTTTKRKFEDNSGAKYCLSDKDIQKGINSIDVKLNKDCPFYRKLDNLFGGRQNVLPSFVMQSTDFNTWNSQVTNNYMIDSQFDDVYPSGSDTECEEQRCDSDLFAQDDDVATFLCNMSNGNISVSVGDKRDIAVLTDSKKKKL
jgi:hypothetical protein